MHLLHIICGHSELKRWVALLLKKSVICFPENQGRFIPNSAHPFNKAVNNMEVCWCQFWMVLHSSSYFWLDTRQLGTYSWVFLKQSLHTGKRLLSYDRCYDKPGCAVKKLHYWETSKMCPGAAGICVYLVSSVSTAGANNCWDSCASVKWSICLENNLRYFHINWWGYIFDLSELIEIKSSFINGKH